MKTRKLLLLGLLPIMFACGGAEDSDADTSEEDTTPEETCTYTYDHTSTIVTWTAFKLSDKVAVDGSFDVIEITPGAESSTDKLEIFTGSTFTIDPSNLNTQDELRDRKLKNSFFGNLDNSGAITGVVNDMTQTSVGLTFTMNGIDVGYTGEVIMDENDVTIKAVIDMNDFEAQVAMDSLSVVCAEKHTGPDGENVLWPDVAVAVKTTLIKECE